VDNADVRQPGRPTAQEAGLPLLRLEQREIDLRKCDRERDTGHASTRSDVDCRPAVGANELETAQRVVDQDTLRLGLVADRSQARRRDNGAQILVDQTGVITTYRFGSVP